MVLGLGHGYGKMSVVKKERIVIVLKEEAIVTLGMLSLGPKCTKGVMLQSFSSLMSSFLSL